MTRDFTLRMYRDLMQTVTDSVYTPTTVCDYLTSPPARAIILRHDVDGRPGGRFHRNLIPLEARNVFPDDE